MTKLFIEELQIKNFEFIKPLLDCYKQEINETSLSNEQYQSLYEAIEKKRMTFYCAKDADTIIGICSISSFFSTYKCEFTGVLEDFYIKKEYRHKGVARNLINTVCNESKQKNIHSIWVGCADMDIELYKSLGFDIELGNLLTWSGG